MACFHCGIGLGVWWKLEIVDGWIVLWVGLWWNGIGELREGGSGWVGGWTGGWMMGARDICNYAEVMAESQLDTFLYTFHGLKLLQT